MSHSYQNTLVASLFVLSVWCGQTMAAAGDLYLGSGAKAGEITDNRAIVHVRLTEAPEQDEQGLIPGRQGQARLRYGLDATIQDAQTTDWQFASADEDYSIQFQLEDLQAGKRYHYRVEHRTDDQADVSCSKPFSFKTAPAADVRAAVRFQVTTGQDVRGEQTYVAMAAQQPDFLVSTGDNVYYDGPPNARDVPGAYAAYQMMYGLPKMKEYFRHVAGYFEKDDHDYRFNDADRWQTAKGGDGGRRNKKEPTKSRKWLTHDEGVMVFKQVFPMSDPTYRTFRWGQGVQIWLLEGRDFRSANNMPDGPEKTLWGKEQLEWLQGTILASDADWRIVISPTPIIGPDRVSKTDNHANPRGFWTEGQAFLDWIKDNQLDNVILACGDRHWQYHVTDQRNDRQVHEFSCGPTCDKHTQKVPPVEGPFIGVARPYSASKGGFLTVTYQAAGTIVFEFFDEVGQSLYQCDFQR